MRIFVVAGVPVSLNIYFLIMMAFYVAAGLGPQVTLLFLLVITHEIAHLLIARVCGIEVLGIELFPFGGMAITGGVPAGEPAVEAAVAAAGPLNNFLLFGLGLAIMRVCGESPLTAFYLDANLTLAFFNMLPALPLDGGRVLRAYVAQATGYSRAAAILSRTGTVVILCLLGWGIASAWRGDLMPNAFAFAFFLHLAARREAESARYLAMRSLLARRESLRKRRTAPIQRMAALGSATVSEVCLKFSPGKQYIVTVLHDSMRVAGELWESEILEWFFAGKGQATLAEVIESRPPRRADGKPT